MSEAVGWDPIKKDWKIPPSDLLWICQDDKGAYVVERKELTNPLYSKEALNLSI